MTNRQIAYQKFLKSKFWLEIRNQCMARDGFKCCVCGNKRQLQAHHVRYPADWYQTTLDMLQTLCRACHKRTHGIKTTVRTRKLKRKALSKLIRLAIPKCPHQDFSGRLAWIRRELHSNGINPREKPLLQIIKETMSIKSTVQK